MLVLHAFGDQGLCLQNEMHCRVFPKNQDDRAMQNLKQHVALFKLYTKTAYLNDIPYSRSFNTSPMNSPHEKMHNGSRDTKPWK